MITELNIPINEKVLITVKEAAAYTHIGEKKIRQLLQEPHCPFLLYNGKNVLIKRERFAEYLKSHDVI